MVHRGHGHRGRRGSPAPRPANGRTFLAVTTGSTTRPALGMVDSIVPWSKRFDDPIPLPDGRQPATLRDVAEYVAKLPTAEQDAPELQSRT
jgi:hypothetical protein